MRREDVERLIRDNAERLRSLGVRSLYLFGSHLRGDARPDSDVDFFMDPAEPERFSLFDLMDVQDRLRDILGVDVDVTTRRSLHRAIRKRIEAEAARLL
jgi:predicted nucleotidyltransferase